LARSLLARLPARPGESAAADEVLAVALAGVVAVADSFVVCPVVVAQVELGWLDGTLGAMTEDARRALELADAAEHRSAQAELTAYLRRAGVDTPEPPAPPGPWAPTLSQHWREAAVAWAALGERYEEALVLAAAPDRAAKAKGLAILEELGAEATLTAV
jgi:hypothetical protein